MELVPFTIVPVAVPPRVPVPVALASENAVELVTFTAFPKASCDCTPFENADPTLGFTPPFTAVIASLLAAPALTVREAVPVLELLVPVTVCAPGTVAVQLAPVQLPSGEIENVVVLVTSPR